MFISNLTIPDELSKDRFEVGYPSGVELVNYDYHREVLKKGWVHFVSRDVVSNVALEMGAPRK